ncbi:alkaline phosphatase [Sporosarcina sp. YIM B06819]|uniref:alkaline phosphatase n=1 Tax=Sporosarcina sp. YIM B06819 TaxID=3081769 RepID=UPI00298C4F8F|nr:alkaline phosphatase [Sporosarcina sp. YIM B06819]
MLKKKIFKKVLPFAVLSTVLVGSLVGTVANPSVQANKAVENNNPEIKNVIFLIGDGMGVSYTSAYRYLKDDPTTPVVEQTEFDKYLVGQQMTYPEDAKETITDSASAATAMSAGVKTYNNAIAMDNDKSNVKTVLEAAKEAGKSTGLVATSEITHATPAAFGAHNESRKNMDEIADDYYNLLINGEHSIDVLLGGGKSNFERATVNLADSFKQDGYSYVTTKADLLKDNNDQVLGLFAAGGLPKMIDRSKEIPSLEEMTTSAIDRLSKNDKGFFLMVEGSQIDWAGHDNDIVGAMSEMEDFEKAFKAAIEFAKKDGHTLVVTTADHSTGGFSIGADGNYNWLTDTIKAAKRTPAFIADEIANGSDVEKTLKKYINQKLLPLTATEIVSVQLAGEKASDIETAIKIIFDKRSYTGWTTGGHTGEDVPVYAFGPSKERFAGLMDNTDHAKIIFDILHVANPNKDKR